MSLTASSGTGRWWRRQGFALAIRADVLALPDGTKGGTTSNTRIAAALCRPTVKTGAPA
ncbi:MAG: hypothetical protein VW802_09835 [Rhodospirillaceae bacterium]